MARILATRRWRRPTRGARGPIRRATTSSAGGRTLPAAPRRRRCPSAATSTGGLEQGVYGGREVEVPVRQPAGVMGREGDGDLVVDVGPLGVVPGLLGGQR